MKQARISIVLALLSLLLIALRLHTYHEPLERDITTYAVIAHEMTEGRALYTDLWDHKPPLIHLTFLLGEKLAPYGAPSVFAVNIVTSIFLLFGLYAAGSLLGGPAWGGVTSATVWTLISGDLYLQGNQPNTELFMNLFLVWGFVLVIQSLRNEGVFRYSQAAGICFAAATLYKQVALLPIAAILVTYGGIAFKSSQRKAVLTRALLLITLIGLGAWFFVAGYFYFQHRFHDFYNAVFRFNFFYISEPSTLAPAPPLVARIAKTAQSLCMGFHGLLMPLILISTIGGVFIKKESKHRSLWALLCAYFIGAFLAVGASSYFFPHYFQLVLPPLCIAAAWTLATLHEQGHRYTVRAVTVCLGMILLAYETPRYFWPAEQWSQIKYEDRFTSVSRMGETINRILQPDETFYNWGNDSGLYFYSKRHPPTGVFYYHPLVKGPLQSPLSQKTLGDLERTQPELVVISKYMMQPDSGKSPIVPWILKHYLPWPENEDQGNYWLWIRKQGRMYKNIHTPR